MRHPPENQPQEVLAGLVERITYHNAENGAFAFYEPRRAAIVMS
jgi:hypothetical protein